MNPLQASSNNSQNASLAVSVLVVSLAVVSVALRFYTRIFTKLGLGADDWFILAAVVAALATAALLLWGNSVDPIGLWLSENTDQDTTHDIFYRELLFTMTILYITIAGATKQGILLMYNRIFNVSTSFRYQLLVTNGLVISWWIGCTVATLTNCIPFKWTFIRRLVGSEYCFNYNVFWMASGACEVFLDVLILTLPVSVVVRMHLSLKQKLTVLGIFMLGWFIIGTGLIKVIHGYIRGNQWPSYSRTGVWSTVHSGMSIVCASLPIFKPLVHRVTGSSFFTRTRRLLSVHRKVETVHSSNEASLGTREDEHVNMCEGYRDARVTVSELPAIPTREPSELSLTEEWVNFLECSESNGTSARLAREEV